MNPNIATCVANAWSAGMQAVDVYVFMCPNCKGNSDPANVTATIVESLQSQNVQYNTMWFDVEQCNGCWNDASSNTAYLQTAVGQAQSMNVNVGIYSSKYEWAQTVGTSEDFSNLPLWYAHYDGQENFNDTSSYSFGGWTSPNTKQYAENGPCTNVDLDYRP